GAYVTTQPVVVHYVDGSAAFGARYVPIQAVTEYRNYAAPTTMPVAYYGSDVYPTHYIAPTVTKASYTYDCYEGKDKMWRYA
ncbi:hypothetical protein ACPUD5_26150, partial [Escherichia coli]|uniref:hypothetical protein n=1 Tax=Escherichia coli TaxID=562 RepID=UPI003CC59F8B